MPELVSFASVDATTAGFLLPIFQTQRQANHQLVQSIDDLNNVFSLEPVFFDRDNLEATDLSVSIDIGKPGIWAFRDADGEIHVGTADKIEAVGHQLLDTGALTKFPMAAAEMVSFCKLEKHYPKIILAAFRALAKLSRAGADVWRDTTLLLPAIRKDLAYQRSVNPARLEGIRNLTVISNNGITHLFAPKHLSVDVRDLPNWQVLAPIFGIREIELHESERGRTNQLIQPSRWLVIGIGGIARFVITRSPFFGSTSDNAVLPGGATVQGSVTHDPINNPENRVSIGIVGSSLKDAKLINNFLEKQASYEHCHILNIRPIGFGTPSPTKLPPEALEKEFRNLKGFWIVAAHRLSQSGGYANSLSASNIACRLVRVAVSGLIANADTSYFSEALQRSSGSSKVGVIGAARFETKLGTDEIVRRVLYSMLCEEVALHSAHTILLLWPHDVTENMQRKTVVLGRHSYEVILIKGARLTKVPYVVGYAFGVVPSKRRMIEFIDFFVSVLAGLDWSERILGSNSFLFENDGRTLRIWPAISYRGIRDALSHIRSQADELHLVITNKTVSDALREEAEDKKVGLAHYSELKRWFNSEPVVNYFRL